MEILLATHNKGKVSEMLALLEDLNIKLVDLDSVDSEFEVEETGKTFEENAVLKAEGYGSRFNYMCIADDSGLCVDALNGGPGVYSARYAPDSPARCQKLLKEMEGIEDRKCRFACCACLYSSDTDIIRRLRSKFGECEDFTFYPDNEHIVTVKGCLEGEVALCGKGTNGFGFDPVVYVPELNCHLAEADSETKNSVSHRGRAMRKIYKLLKAIQ